MRSSLSSWQQTLTKLGRRAKPPRSAKRGATNRRRSAIEHLEDRNLLSLTVNTTVDENDGYDVGNRSLREAIDRAFALSGTTETIEFDQSLTGQTIELTLGQITIDSDVNIVGLGAGSLTVDANGLSTESRVFTVNSGKNVTISGLSITGGRVTGTSDGGAIYNSGTLQLNDVTLIDNSSEHYGGAIYNNGGVLTIVDSTIESNSAARGAGIYYNRGTGGGTFKLINSAILSNHGGSYGGGLFVYAYSPATVSIVNSTFSGNTAQHGAAIITDGSPSVTVINSTITKNAATQQGGGIRNLSSAATALHNTILAGNTAGAVSTANLGGSVNAASSYNLVGPGNSTGFSSSASLGNQLGVSDPGLGALDYHGGPTKTHALVAGSLAIDKGRNDQSLHPDGYTLTFDQRWFTRIVDFGAEGPVDGTVDIGAVEWHQPVAIGDFDGDGRDDEAFIGNGTALYVASKPSGKLKISKWGTLPATAVTQWLVGDFNGDGRDDVAFRTNDYLKIWYVALSESTQFVITGTNFGFNEWQLALTGDFDGDGRDELIGRYDSNGDSVIDKWSLIDYDAAGQFSQYDIGSAFTSSFYTKVHVGDVNGDGRDDLVARLAGADWGFAITTPDNNGRIQLPSQVMNFSNWFRDPWIKNAGTATETVDVEGPYRRLLEIFSEVYNTIELELYPGLMKGIQATAETKAGNPWDQAALLVDRLDAEGFQSKIVFGQIDAPLNEVRDWLGVTENIAAERIIEKSLDANAEQIGSTMRFRHAWVQVAVPTSSGVEQIYLDPSWKFKDRPSGAAVNLANETSPTFGINGRIGRGTFDELGYLADAGENQLPLEWYEDQVMRHLVDTGQYKSLTEIAYDGPVRQKTFTHLPNSVDKLLGGSAIRTPGTNTESFENLEWILSDPEETNRFVHQATISIEREVAEGPRIVPLELPVNVGDELPSNDSDSPETKVVNPASSSTGNYIFEIDPGPNDIGSTTTSNGVRRISGTKHLTINIPNSYPITANTRLQISYNSNAAGHRFVYGWDWDTYNENEPNERIAYHTITANPQTLILPALEENADVNATKVVLGLRHEYHNNGVGLSTNQWIDITDIRLYEANTGEAVVEDLSGFKTIRQTGGHFFSLDVSELQYEVAEDSILLVEYDQQGNSGPNLLGWDLDNVSSNDAGQVSNLFSLHGSVSGYPQAVHIEYLPDGFRRMYLPIGQELAAGQSAPLHRLLFYTDYPLNPSNPNVMLFRNLAISTSRVGTTGEHWTSEPLAIPQVGLSSITIDYAKNENSPSNSFDDTYNARLLIDGQVIEQGVGDEVFQEGDKSEIQIHHLSPTEFGVTILPTAAVQTFDRKTNQIHAIAFDANQYSRQHLVELQAGLNGILANGVDVSDIDELLSFTGSKYWYELNKSNDTIDALMHTVGAQQWVGSGMVTADPILIGGDLTHLNFPIAPLNMGVDLPNSTHSSYDVLSGNSNGEAFQLVGWNASALEHATVEEIINAESISTIRGLQYGFEDSLRVFESVVNSQGGRTIYFRGTIGEHPAAGDPLYNPNRTDRQIVQALDGSSPDIDSLEYWISDLSDKVINDIWAALNEAVAVGDTVRVIAPRLHSSVGDAPLAWDGAVYVAEVNKATSRSGRYTIVPFDGSAPTSGGYSGNKIAPINLNLPKLNNDLRGWAGDPVSVANGNMFRDEVDFAYSNLGVPLNFARHYESGSKYDVGLGVGWTHSFSDRLLQDPDDLNTIEWLTSTGTLLKFTKSGSTWLPPDSRFGQFLAPTSSTFVWKGADGMEYHFKKGTGVPAGDGKDFIARLEKIVDRDGHGVQLTYDTATPFKLTQVQDIHDASRYLALAYNGSNRIATVSLFVAGANNGTWTYAYNTGSGQPPAGTRLTKVTTPSDAHTAAHETKYEYFTSGPSLGLISKIIEPDGGYHKYEYFANGRVFRVTESVDTKQTATETDDVTTSQSFNYNLFRELTEFTDENGNVETYVHDEKGQLLRQVHNDRSRLIYEYGTKEATYDESALMTKVTDERGAFETFTYFRPSDSGQPGYSGRRGELKQHTGKDNVTTNFEYWSHPYISEIAETVVTDGGTNITTSYTRDSLGHVTSVTDPLGKRTDYTYYSASDPAHLRGLRKSEIRPQGVPASQSQEAATWEILNPSFSLYGDTLSIQLLSGAIASEQVAADAVRIDRIDQNGDVVFTRIIDDDGAGEELGFRRESGSFTAHPFTLTGYGGSVVLFYNSSTEQPVATWIFEGLEPGTYRISATWPAVGTGADHTTKYRVFDGLPSSSPNFTSSPKDQQVSPDDFGNFQTIYQYDASGNLTSAIVEQLPAGAATYDHFGKVISSTDATGVSSFGVQDILGRAVKVGLADPDGTTEPLAELATTFVYDAMGRLVESTDALNRVASSQYDLKGRLIKQTFADGSAMEYGYDGKGNRTSITDELGRTTTFIYDDRDRVIQTIHPDGTSDRIQYDGSGNITTTTDALGRCTEFTYDKAGRLLSTKFAAGTNDEIQTTNKYDSLGRLEETVDANGNKTKYRHDALGRVVETRVLDKTDSDLPPKFLSTTEYDANGRVVRTTVYDASRLLASVASGGAGLSTIPPDPTTLIDSLGESVFLHVTETHYDAFGRPVKSTYADGTSTSTVYDAAGRVRYQFDELNRRTELTYDEYGRLSKTIAPDPDGDSGTQLSPETEYKYDAVGNIVTIIDARDFVMTREYDARNRLIAEIDSVGSVRRTIYDVAGQSVATIDPRGFAASTHYDERGRSVLEQLVDPDGTGIASAPTTRRTYDEVGNVRSSTDALGNTAWFEYDSLNRLRTESRYETLIADDSSDSDSMFSTDASAVHYVSQTQYGRDYTSLEPGTDAEATWTFSDLDAASYRVSMTWPGSPDYGAVVVYIQHYRNGQHQSTASTVVYQSQSPNDLFIPHGNHELGWEILASSINVIAGDTLKIVVAANLELSVIADAVRIDRLVSKEYEYDDNGNLVSTTDTLGHVTAHNYDELNRLHQTISADPDGLAAGLTSIVTERIYDGFGNIVRSETGHVTGPQSYSSRRTDRFEFDKRNRLVKETIDAGAGRENVVTEYEYDAVGNTVLATDAEGFQTHYRYDNLDRIIDEYRDFGEGREAPLELTEAMIGSYYVDGLFVPSSHDISSDGSSISLTGTAWKTIAIDHLVQHDTVLEFEFSADTEAPAHLIGFDSNNNFEPADEPHFFKLGGSGTFGDQYRTDFRREPLADGTMKFHIPIGQYLSDQEKLTGLSINRLVLVNWETGLGLNPIDRGKSTFSNIRLYESDEQRTVTTYDEAGNVETVRTASDPRNITTRYEYDGVGRQTREILDADGSMERSYSTVYDASGNVLIERNDTAGTETVHQYDSLNRRTRTTLPDLDGNPATANGLRTLFQYDTAGNRIRTTNGENEKTYTDYDAQGRVITETDGNGDQTHYRYDSEGNLLSITDAEENVTSYTYDALNRLKTETNAFGTRTHAYDNAGNLNSITDRNGRIREFTYDTLDRRTLEKWKTATNSTVTHQLSWQYDDLGRIIKQTDSFDATLGDADDLVDTFEYDGLGRPTEQTNYDPLTAPGSGSRPEIRQAYDFGFEFWPIVGFRERTSREDERRDGVAGPVGQTVSYFDRLGQLQSLEDNDAEFTSATPNVATKTVDFLYDASGNINRITRDGAIASTLSHDSANRLTSITHGLATSIVHTYAYDNASRITSFNTTGTGAANRTHGYDDAGQLVSKTGGAGESYDYDDNGNRTEVDGQSVNTGPGNRLAEDDSYFYTYDAEGNLTRFTDKVSGEVTQYTWDHRNRLTNVDTVTPPPTLTFPTSGGFSSYTAQGQSSTGSLAVEDSGKTVHLADKMWRRILLGSLGLPASYQLTENTVLSFDFQSPQIPGIAAIGLDNNNSYSDPYRHFQIAGTDTSGSLSGISPNVTYGGGWQRYEIRLADFGTLYSGGNAVVTHLTLISNGTGQSYFSNVRLYEATSSESIEYTYDAQDRRVQRIHDANGAASGNVTSQYFVYDGADLSMTFGNTGELTHRYLYGPQTDQVLVDEVFAAGQGGQRVSDEVLWLLADHQGTIRDIVDGDGDLRKHINYDSFGNFNFWDSGYYDRDGAPIEGTMPWENPEALTDQLFHYTGQEWDAGAGLYNYSARWYDPRSGRFLSEDPSSFDGGDPNLYRYVGNSPLNGIDPTGLFTQKPTDYLPALSGSPTGFSGGTSNQFLNDLAYSSFDAPTTSTWNVVGNALGSSTYRAANSYFGPVRQAAVGAGVAFAAAGLSLQPPPYYGDPERDGPFSGLKYLSGYLGNSAMNQARAVDTFVAEVTTGTKILSYEAAHRVESPAVRRIAGGLDTGVQFTADYLGGAAQAANLPVRVQDAYRGYVKQGIDSRTALALGFGQSLPGGNQILTAEELYSGLSSRPGTVNAVLSQPEIEQRFGSLVTDAQMAGFSLTVGGPIRNRGNGGRGGNIEHAQVQRDISFYAGGDQEVRVYEGGPGSRYRIVDNVDSLGRYHQVGDMRYRGERYSPSAQQRGAIEDLRHALGTDAIIIYHDKMGRGPTIINPDLQPNWRPAPAAHRTFGRQ